MTNTNNIKDMELTMAQLEEVSGGIESEDVSKFFKGSNSNVGRCIGLVAEHYTETVTIIKNPSILISVIKSWF
ncbi:hypothetical protein [Ruminococcus sp.]|uniref:hypothetical protein n=1 Tax=Ruminococcus sp. TaxID=41978 RepID=UPI0025FCE06A|nr:hypothetical protein [Ruminococcus sp.]MBQ8964991.1 hypothetical protein [Ruminococcus sp.]